MPIQNKQALDKTFHALGDGTRRQILSMLAKTGACSANELCEPFQSSQPTISKHLKVLEKAGLVHREVAGRTHRFELVTAAMDDANDWINRHKTFWEGTLKQLDTFLSNQPEPPEKT